MIGIKTKCNGCDLHIYHNVFIFADTTAEKFRFLPDFDTTHTLQLVYQDSISMLNCFKPSMFRLGLRTGGVFVVSDILPISQ